MTLTNPIQRLILDIEFNGINQSNNYLFDKLSSLSSNKIIPVLSNFFDEEQFSKLYFEFNSLQLDLGIIEYENFEEIFEQKLKEALIEKFKDYFNNNVQSNDIKLKNNNDNLLELIRYFLLNGRLPWWANKYGNISIEGILTELINKSPQLLKNLLYEIGYDENVRKRLAFTFSEDIIKGFVKVLQPADFDYFFAFHDYVKKVNKEDNLLNETETKLSKIIWYNILSYILVQKSSVFEKKEFLKKSIIAIAAYYNINFKDLIITIFNAITQINATFNSELYNLSKDIQTIIFEEFQYLVIDPIEIKGSSIKKSFFKKSQGTKKIIYDKETQKLSIIPDRKYESYLINNKIDKNYIQLDDDTFNLIYILNYYLTNGSLPVGYEYYTIQNLQNIFYKLFQLDSNITKSILLNITINRGSTYRIFTILNKYNYKFSLDIIIYEKLKISINDLHKSFIQMLINQNRSTAIFLDDNWKIELLHFVYTRKKNIHFEELLFIYLEKYAKNFSISIPNAFAIYDRENKLLKNQLILSKLATIKDLNFVSALDNIPEEYTIITNKALIDLIKFIIDFGFAPWWGKSYLQDNFKELVDANFIENKHAYISLLIYSTNNEDTKNRFFNLLGDEKVEDLLVSIIQKSDDQEFYKFIKQYFLNYFISDQIFSIKNRILILLLLENLKTSNFKIFSDKNFLVSIIDYLSNRNTVSNNEIIQKLLFLQSNIQIEKNIYLYKFNLLLTTINKNSPTLLFTNYFTENFELTITKALNKNKFEISLLNEFINLIFIKDSNKTIDKPINHFLYLIIIEGKVPNPLRSFKELNYETLIIYLVDYLFKKDKSSFINLFSSFNLFKNEYKIFFTDWIFRDTNNYITQQVADLILPFIQENYTYFNSIHNYENSIFYYNNPYNNTKYIENIHKKLQIKTTSKKNIIYEKYQLALLNYLKFGFIDNDIKQQDDILKYLIISIFQKSQKSLIDIFNHTDNKQDHKNHIISLFQNANNIIERQVYYSLFRTLNNQDDYVTNIDFNENTTNLIINEKKDIDIIQFFKNTLNKFSSTDIDISANLVKIIEHYLTQKTRHPLFTAFTSFEYDVYIFKIFDYLQLNASKVLASKLNYSKNNLDTIIYIYRNIESYNLSSAEDSRKLLFSIIKKFIITHFEFSVNEINLLNVESLENWIKNILDKKILDHVQISHYLKYNFNKIELINYLSPLTRETIPLNDNIVENEIDIPVSVQDEGIVEGIDEGIDEGVIGQDNLQNYKIIKNVSALLSEILNIKNISETTLFSEIKKELIHYLQIKTKPPTYNQYSQKEYDFYITLMVIELVKKSPAELFSLLSNNSNNINYILYLFNFFKNAQTGYEYNIKNIFIDFFNQYIQHYFENKVGSIDKITTTSFEKWLTEIFKEKYYTILQIVLISNNQALLNKINFKSIYDLYFQHSNSFDKTILFNLLNLMIDSFTTADEKLQLNKIIYQYITYNIANSYNDKSIKLFLEYLLLLINKADQKEKNYFLRTIIYKFQNTFFTQPSQFIQLIDFVISKSKNIINYDLQLNTTKNAIIDKDDEVLNTSNTIKKVYEESVSKNKVASIQKDIITNNLTDNTKVVNEPIYINNIGLILFHIFIPTYFGKLNLLNDEGEFKDEESKFRAVHLLQILVTDNKYDEHELVLNKILCNLDITIPIPMDIEFTDAERNLSIELGKVVLQRWDKMKNASIGHFRAAFLMRDGRIILKEDGWYLNVEKRGYDIILGSLPWAFGVIKFKWMPKFLYTEWT